MLIAINRSAWILAHRAFTAQISKVPDSIGLAAHNVVITVRLTRQLECVLAAEEEGRLIASVRVVAVLSTRCWHWHTTVSSRTPRLTA